MLKTETNTETMDKKILAAARKQFGRSLNPETVFEHGHWWVYLKNSAQYAVNDAEGIGTVNGFNFEQITSAWDE